MKVTFDAAQTHLIPTSHADLSVLDFAGRGTPIVFLHGNSLSKEVFGAQLQALAPDHRAIAIDLPGHGASANARDPRRSYSLEGYADCVVETIEALGIEQAVVVGWSQGGHIGYELIERFSGLKGLLTVGSPPMERLADGTLAGFRPFPKLALASTRNLSELEIDEYAVLVGDFESTQDMLLHPDWRAAISRTDGLARQYVFEALSRQPPRRQRELAENAAVPLAIVLGSEDRFVDLDYVASLNYRNLWSDHPIVLAGCGHAPFLHETEEFNRMLRAYVADVDSATPAE